MILTIATGLWIVFILIYFWIMLLKYPLGHWEEGNPYAHETLGIPPGTIRTVLALTMTFMFILSHSYSLAFEAINTDSVDNATMLVLGFYFADRTIKRIVDGQQ